MRISTNGGRVSAVWFLQHKTTHIWGCLFLYSSSGCFNADCSPLPSLGNILLKQPEGKIRYSRSRKRQKPSQANNRSRVNNRQTTFGLFLLGTRQVPHVSRMFVLDASVANIFSQKTFYPLSATK